MAKWYGKVGYAKTEETKPGVWTERIIDREHFGDIIKVSSRWQTGNSTTNDDLNLSNQISILADPFARQNFSSIRYVEFMGTRWKVTDVSIEYPRIILTIGGVYNGQQT